ncbi:MAG: DNA mismatch repair endonuclease MutL, partial [Candidatus Thorarchaeota archaeon]|nr:DNA mismatch repair endonuclease MutL [Candidatus Thorarchaeota archaeon]
MGKIRVLAEDLVSLISAGEVIENPSSIVKELIENALDAGADMIDIAINEGGIRSITVSDNGSGILRDDCPVCLLRHSTSKINTKEDIDEISTYGFRGEALASISAVADIRIATRTRNEETGSLVIARFGETPSVVETSRPKGTTIEVTDLFKNIPARRKHLSEARVESQRIQEVVMKQAAILPEIGFRLIRDGNTIIDCPPNQGASDRIASLWGIDIAKALVNVDHSLGNIKISGFVARPPVSRGNRSREYFSILKRPISDERLSRAVESAYSTTLMKGQYPICALDISMELSKVDVNVHPTKREVRVLDIDKVCDVVKEAVRQAFGIGDVVEDNATLQSSLDETIEIAGEVSIAEQSQRSSRQSYQEQIATAPLVEQTILVPSSESTEEDSEVDFLGGVFRIIGQMHDLYILLESEEGLLIIDQHAAHERVLYEQLRKEVNQDRVAVQELLQPFILSLSPKDAEQIVDLADTLESIGYTISSFGGNEVSISTLPEILGRTASETELLTLIDRILDLGGKEAEETFMDNLVKVTACHSAVRAGQALSTEEIRDIIVELSATTGKYNCCHGRPSMIRIRKEDIDRSVGRMGASAIARYKARHGLK